MPGDPFDATWTDDEDEARAAVRDGTAVAAVLVDLRETTDVVLVNARADDDLNQAVVDQISAVEKTHERTVEVQHVAGSDSDGAADRVRLFALLCGLVGFGFVLVVSLVRGPVARTAGLGVVRVLGLGAVSLAGAALLQFMPRPRSATTPSPYSGWAPSTRSRSGRSRSPSRRWPGSSAWWPCRRRTSSWPRRCWPAPAPTCCRRRGRWCRRGHRPAPPSRRWRTRRTSTRAGPCSRRWCSPPPRCWPWWRWCCRGGCVTAASTWARAATRSWRCRCGTGACGCSVRCCRWRSCSGWSSPSCPRRSSPPARCPASRRRRPASTTADGRATSPSSTSRSRRCRAARRSRAATSVPTSSSPTAGSSSSSATRCAATTSTARGSRATR